MTGGGRRFKPARGWERGGGTEEREDASRLFVCRASGEGGEELPGERGAPGRSGEGERREKARGEVQRQRSLPGSNSISRPRRLLTGKLGGSVDFKLLPPLQLDPK